MQAAQSVRKYSEYTRNRIISLHKLGYRIVQIQSAIGHQDKLKLSRQGISRIVEQYKRTHSTVDAPRKNNKESKITPHHLDIIDLLIQQDRQITASEIRDTLAKNHGLQISCAYVRKLR